MTNLDITTTDGQQTIATTIGTKLKRLEEKQGLQVPENYSVSNALQGAVLTIGNDRKLANASLDSIQKTLFDMVIQGLSVSKTQCYFINYGGTLQMQRSYFGTQAVLKRLPEIKDITAEVVHEGDKFEIGYVDGVLVVKEHDTKIENLDNDFIAVYSVITKTDGTKQYEVMTSKQVHTSWGQSKSGGAVQKKFPEEMAKRTVINRAAKNIVNTSTGDDRLINAFNETTDSEFDNDVKDVTPKVTNKALEKIVENKNDDVEKDDSDKKENIKVVEKMAEGKQLKSTNLFDDINDVEKTVPEQQTKKDVEIAQGFEMGDEGF